MAITTRFTSFTTTPVLGTPTFPEDIDVRNAEMESRMQEMDAIGQEMNGLADEMDSKFIAASTANYKGEYDPLTTYALGEVVSFNGYFYLSQQNANTGQSLSNITWWKKGFPLDSEIVHNTGDEDIDGIKNFIKNPIQKLNKNISIDFASDADLTLSSDQNQYGYITLTDTGVVLSTSRNIIVDNTERQIVFTNNTAQTLTIKTAAGTGIEILSGGSDILYCDGTDIIKSVFTSGNNTFSGTNTYTKNPIQKLNKNISIDFASDADLTLSSDQNQYGYITLTDTGVVLSTSRNIIVDNTERQIVFTNNTAQTLTIKTAAGTGVEIYPSSNGTKISVYCDGTNVIPYIDEGISNKYLIAQVRLTAGSNGQAPSTSWAKINIDTVRANNIQGASVASAVFTLPAGKYKVYSRVPYINNSAGNYRVATRIYNTTDAAELLAGSPITYNVGANLGTTNNSFVDDVFEILASKTIELQAIATATSGLYGAASNLGSAEVHSEIIFEKIG